MHLTSALFGYSVRRQISLSSTGNQSDMLFSKIILGLIFIIICDGIKNIIMMDLGSVLIWGIFDCFLVSLLIIQLLEKFPKKVSVLLLISWIFFKTLVFKMGFVNSEVIVMDQFHQNKFKVLLSIKTFSLFFLLGVTAVHIFLGKKTFKHWPYCLFISLLWFFYEPSIPNYAVSQNYMTAITIGELSKQNTYPLLHWFPVILAAYLLPDLMSKLDTKFRFVKILAVVLFIGLPFFSGNLAQGADLNGFMSVALRDHYNTLFFAQMAYLIVFLQLSDKFKFDNQITKLITYGYIFNYFVLFFIGSSLTKFLNDYVPRDFLFLASLFLTSVISILVGRIATEVFSKKIEIKLVKSSN